jgi:hypothetical protein
MARRDGRVRISSGRKAKRKSDTWRRTINDVDLRQDLTEILSNHDDRWSVRRDLMRTYKNAYDQHLWKSYESTLMSMGAGTIGIETNRGRKYVDQFVSVLFLREPGVIVDVDPLSQQDPEPVQAIVNRWISTQRTVFENVTRLALIYPCGFLKLCWDDTRDDLDASQKLSSLQLDALQPWDVILDLDQGSWDRQRYVGCVRWTPILDVLDSYDVGLDELRPKHRVDLLKDRLAGDIASPSALKRYGFIRVVELWDKRSDSLYVWTPDHRDGFLILKEGPIPVRTVDDQPLPQILPLYFNWQPDDPLEGSSALGSLIPLLLELNKLMTMRSRRVKSDARKYLVDSTLIDDQAYSDLLSPEDGTYIKVNLAGKSVRDLVAQLTAPQLTPDFEQEIREITMELERATSLPAFARGEITGATATETSITNNYAQNDIGKLARQKAELVERVAELYVRSLINILDDDDPISVIVQGESQIVQKETLKGAFEYDAVDGDSSPITQEARKQQLLVQAPLLVQLSTQAPSSPTAKAILDEVIRIWNWPKEFGEVPQPQVPAGGPGPQTSPADSGSGDMGSPMEGIPGPV